MNKERIIYLLQQVQQKKASSQEQDELLNVLQQDAADDIVQTIHAYHEQYRNEYHFDYNDPSWNNLLTKVLAADALPETASQNLFRMRYWWAAAIVVVLLGSGIYFWNQSSQKPVQPNSIASNNVTIQPDITPGTNKAILTLADGTRKELSNADNGMQLKPDAVLLTTPRGGQYQAVLPDGSKVWLNAASSIQFPSAFNDKERRATVTGEVYFEIAKDAQRPFKVYSDKQEIEVLGTSFNINMYDNEPIKKTTLITGSIKITSNNQTAILKPGQQANIPILSILPIRLIPVQTDEVLAWKNGLFNFENKTLEEVMRQLSRWYNIDVQYNGPIPSTKFRGALDRNLKLNEVLEILQESDIKYELGDRTLVIKP